MTIQEKLTDNENLTNSIFTILGKDIPLSCFVFSMKSKITFNNSSVE